MSITFSITHVILKAIHAGVGFGSGTESTHRLCSVGFSPQSVKTCLLTSCFSLSLSRTHSTKLKRYETNGTCTSDCVNTSVYSSFLLQPYSNVTLQYQVPVYIPVMMRAHMKISGQFHTASNKSCRGHVLFPFVLPSINQKGFKFLTSRPGLMQVLVWRLQGQQLHVYHTVLYTPSGAASDPFSITL